MSSGSGGRSVLAPADTNAEGLFKRSKIKDTRSILLSVAKSSTHKRLPRGIEASVLSELDCLFDGSWKASHVSDSESCNENVHSHKALLSSEKVGLLRPRSLLGGHSNIADASQPMVHSELGCLLDWPWEAPYNSDKEGSKNIKSILPLKLSLDDEAEHFVKTANNYKSPATCCSEFPNQFPDIDETSKQLSECKIPAVILLILGGLACVGLEHILKPKTKECSCSVLWGGCAAEDGKHESGSHHGSHHPMLLPEEGTKHKDTTASPELPIASDELHASDSITDNNKLKFVSKGNAGKCEKDLTGKQSFGARSTKGLQLTSACTCNQLRSVGRSTRKRVSQTGKFFPIANKNHLASATHEYKPSMINSEAIVFSSTTDQSKGRENQSDPNDLKLSPVCCSDEKDSLPIELYLQDEDNLITVDDFRVLSYNDMPDKNLVLADVVGPSAPVDSSRKPMDTKAGITDEKSTHVKSVRPFYKGKMSYCASLALINSQVKAKNPKFKPHNPLALMNSQVKAKNPKFKPYNPSNQAFFKCVLPVSFKQSQAIKVQQLHQILSKRRKRIPDDLRRYLATKGTTIVFLFQKNDIYLVVDSRESMYQDSHKLITNEKLRKYWIFWKRIFVVYTGDVLIGSGLLQYLRRRATKKPMSITDFVLMAYDFSPTDDGESEAWIGGLRPDGEPFLFVLSIGRKKEKLEMHQRLRPFTFVGCTHVVGAGATSSKSFLRSRPSVNTPEERKYAAVGSFVSASLRNEDSGGYTNLINLRMDGGQYVCDSVINRTLKSLIDYTASWQDDPTLCFTTDNSKTIPILENG